MTIMKRNKIKNHSLLIFIISSLFLLETTVGYPIEKLSPKPDLKDETRYSNGTIIGKYMYTDTLGNPIHVKYYADDGSYGVELQSVKVIDSDTNEPITFPKPKFETIRPIESPFGADLVDKPFYRNKYKSDGKNYKNKAKNNKKLAKSSIEYEVFYQNNLQGPTQCETDKVKVYLDKHNRITRNNKAVDEDQAAKYCEQF